MRPLDLLGSMVNPATRAETGRDLAAALGADDLIVFVRDPELDILVPAPGFAQAIPNATEWRPFLTECLSVGTASGKMSAVGSSAPSDACGYGVGDDGVVVLIGGQPRHPDVAAIRPAFPLLVGIVKSELAARVRIAEAEVARRDAAKAAVLAEALESSRDRLRDALASAARTRAMIEHQTMELAASAQQLALSRQALEANNEELEALNEELESTNEALHATNAALERTTHEAEIARDEAQEANRSKSRFLATMSHELRTPLNAIGGYAALLAEQIAGPITQGQEKYLERIRRSQMHLSGLIGDVLNFAKVESGTLSYRRDSLDLETVLTDVSAIMETQARAKDVTFSRLPLDPNPAITGDRDKIMQVVLNLLGNAIKFTPPGGEVTLRAKVLRGVVRILVSDSGPGIPVERLGSIFDPFVQLDRTLTQDREGVGLGLSISRELARGMGGDLTVESVGGQGSTFIFTLGPATQERSDSGASPG